MKCVARVFRRSARLASLCVRAPEAFDDAARIEASRQCRIEHLDLSCGARGTFGEQLPDLGRWSEEAAALSSTVFAS